MGWSWVILTLVVQLGAQMIKPQTYARGKLLTMPLKKKFPKTFNHPLCRLFQILILIGLYLSVGWFIPGFGYFYCLTIMAMSIDDYFSDDDDRKRFKSLVRNKIKWKMELPKPVQVKGTA